MEGGFIVIVLLAIMLDRVCKQRTSTSGEGT